MMISITCGCMRRTTSSARMHKIAKSCASAENLLSNDAKFSTENIKRDYNRMTSVIVPFYFQRLSFH